MSKVYETRTVPARERRACVRRRCDLCGRESKGSDWDCGRYEVRETEVKVAVRRKEGHSYPDGGSGTEYEVDLCPDCFKGRLVPWLRPQGADVRPAEWDW